MRKAYMNDVELEELEDDGVEYIPLSELNFDSDSRDIWIKGEITINSIDYAKRVIEINKEDEENEIPIEEREPIKIYLACDGGDVSIGFAIANVIECSKTPVYGITTSHAYSMGCIISTACHKRYCYKNSTFLIHDGSGGIQNAISKIKDFGVLIALNEQAMKGIFLERTKISQSLLEEKFEKDWYIGASEALELGLVDEILKEII